jgi:hypothetical protein
MRIEAWKSVCQVNLSKEITIVEPTSGFGI